MASTENLDSRKVCLFTGASGTLGTAFCQMFRKHYRIAAVCGKRLPSVPSQYSQTLDALNPSADVGESDPVFVIKADLLDEREIQRVVELTLARFGRIDLLVNAAVHSRWAPAVESHELIASASRQFDMNVIVPLKLAVTVAREFWRDRDRENVIANRNVVNVSSSAGVYVYPNTHQSIYSASKAALNFLSCHLAGEFQSFGVRVNVVAPNSFPSLIPTRRVANGIHRLDCDTTNGQILIIDSGGNARYRPE